MPSFRKRIWYCSLLTCTGNLPALPNGTLQTWRTHASNALLTRGRGLRSTACAIEALQVPARDGSPVHAAAVSAAARARSAPIIEARSGSSPDHLYSEPNRDEYDPEHQKQAHHINSSSPTF